MEVHIDPVGRPKEESFDDHSYPRQDDGGNKDRKPEVACPEDDLIGEVGPDHEHSPLGKIENAQDAEDKAHARGN